MANGRLVPVLRTAGRQLVQGLLQLVYPSSCFACNHPLSAEPGNFCLACRTALTADPFPSCPRCAGTVGPSIVLRDGRCPRCRGESFHFDGARRLGPYTGVLAQVILRMKHASGETLAEVLGELWAAHAERCLRELRMDVVVPVPLHWWRRWQRGYNQSEVLAEALAKRLDLPYRPRGLRRVRNTPRQTFQRGAVRRENVRQAFVASAQAGLRGKAVLLVDDVLTTGSTATDAARALRAAGAASVVVAVLAGGHD